MIKESVDGIGKEDREKKGKREEKRNKRGFASSAIGWWLIGLGVVVVMFIFYKFVIEGNVNIIELIKEKWRFGT